ncbi:MAG TPA: hypothetical protein DCF70_07390 [Treponema sp.]|nr:hypothetical protein [Treponema sp.]
MSDHKAEIYYYDIGDYLSREQKLDIITNFKSMENLPFTRLTPNTHGDWLSQRNDKFGTWIPIGDKDNKDNRSTVFLPKYARGVGTSRDQWAYNFSKQVCLDSMKRSDSFFNQQRKAYQEAVAKNPDLTVEDFIDTDERKISWSRAYRNDVKRNCEHKFDEKFSRVGLYRPFCTQNLYFDRNVLNDVAGIYNMFPTTSHKNLVICVSGLGGSKVNSSLIVNTIPDLNTLDSGTQCFPLYWYETIEPDQNSLFGDDDAQIVKHEAVSDFILERAQSKYGNKVQREDIFYYVYGILHSKSYRETFSADLKKMLPRIPLVSDYEKFWAFSKAGRDLANLHLNYEKVAPCPDVSVESLNNAVFEIPKPRNASDDAFMVAEGNASANPDEYAYYAVEQMKFPKKGQKDTIIYNHYHTIKNIPEKAYEYVVNGKSAIEWIMERYAVTTDQKSGITNNPNDWSREHEKPRYIFDLLLSVINVSVQTVGIVNGLPEVDWDKE